jgi:LuxR family maltose regulon positive regulatory protein
MKRLSTPERRLLDAKLDTPTTSPAPIFRQEITDLVCSAGRGVKLVLICAAAGFGKTTMMVQCRERLDEAGTTTAWLTLDRADNDASRFLSVLSAATAGLVAEDGAEGQAQSRRHHSRTAGDTALEVFDRVAGHPAPFALFLDDFEVIHEPGVHALVRELIDHLPRHGQLIVGSRTMPDLRLGRLRASGQLLEIDAYQLRFSLDETAEFFTAHRKLSLTFEDLTRLHRKTEGWVAALWLASLALERNDSRSEFIERFSGSDQSVADYLAEEVLARQRPEIRDFLVRTSVLKHLDPGLCNAILRRTDSEDILRELEKTNALLVRVGHEQHIYRYHSMFARFLQAQLSREAPSELHRLHRAAADWYESQQRPVPAIDHAVDGGDLQHAVRMLAQHAGTLLAAGRMRLLSRWFTALPASLLEDQLELQAVKVWALCFGHGPWKASALLDASNLKTSRDPRVLAHMLALRPLLLAMMDRYEDAYAIGRESLSQLPTGVPFADTVLANAMTTIVSVMGEFDEARRLLDTARRAQGENWSNFNLMYSEAAEGIIDLQAGRMRQATARFRMAVSASHKDAYSYTHGNAWAGVLYAAAVYEENDLRQAAHLLQVYLPLARDIGLADQVIMGYVIMSRTAFFRGDVDQAYAALTELEYLGHQRQLPRVVAGANLERARIHLHQGHTAAATDELKRADHKDLWLRVDRLRLLANDIEYLELGNLRWETLAGDPLAAARRLAAEVASAQRGARRRRAYTLQLLQCVALHRGGDAAACFTLLRGVLKALCDEGFMRLVLDEGASLGALVRELASNVQRQGDVQRDPIFAQYLQHLSVAFGPAPAVAEQVQAGALAVLLEPLSRKEIGVLQLLAEGYSNNAMAEKLFVSDSTVRTHLRNINSKLDTHSRTQAVAMARRLGLVN